LEFWLFFLFLASPPHSGDSRLVILAQFGEVLGSIRCLFLRAVGDSLLNLFFSLLSPFLFEVLLGEALLLAGLRLLGAPTSLLLTKLQSSLLSHILFVVPGHNRTPSTPPGNCSSGLTHGGRRRTRTHHRQVTPSSRNLLRGGSGAIWTVLRFWDVR
jgi:hypothetical protein